MAGARGQPDTSLIRRLFQAPHRFRFFQAVRIIEFQARREAESRREEPRRSVGGTAEPRNEAVRFRAQASLGFPAAEITDLKQGANGRAPVDMTVSFFGLTGPSGVLPQHYTAQLIRSLRDKSFSFRDFLDVFNHRLVSLFTRAWGKYRLPIAYERAAVPGADPVSEALRGIIGMATAGVRDRSRVGDETLLHYAGHFAHFPRSAAGLEAMLSDYFARPVRVEQFRGRRLVLPRDQLTRLGTRGEPEGRFCQLGIDATVGGRVHDVQSGFRLHIGPLDYAQFSRFMPDGADLTRLAELTALYVDPALGFDVALTLKKEDVPCCQLARSGATSPRLGWNTWLKDRPFLKDPADAVFLR